MTDLIEHRAAPQRLAVSQSNYLPWLGYFALINKVDTFVVYDSVQFTKNDWRNRNRIKSVNDPFWITVPCLTKGRLGQSIGETQVKQVPWARKHISAMRMSYAKSPFFAWFEDRLFPVLEELQDELSLSRLNQRLLALVVQDLGIPTRIVTDQAYFLSGDANQKLIHLCKELQASEYVSGPSAAVYLDEEHFSANGVRVTYMDYSPITSFLERHTRRAGSPLSVVDTIAHLGLEEASQFLKGLRGHA